MKHDRTLAKLQFLTHLFTITPMLQIQSVYLFYTSYYYLQLTETTESIQVGNILVDSLQKQATIGLKWMKHHMLTSFSLSIKGRRTIKSLTLQSDM